MSQRGGSGHIPPWMFLSLSSDPRLISLWSLYALARASKLPLAHSCYLLYSWDEHPGKPCPLISRLWSAHFLFNLLYAVDWHRNDIKQCKSAGQWAPLSSVLDNKHTPSFSHLCGITSQRSTRYFILKYLPCCWNLIEKIDLIVKSKMKIPFKQHYWLFLTILEKNTVRVCHAANISLGHVDVRGVSSRVCLWKRRPSQLSVKPIYQSSRINISQDLWLSGKRPQSLLPSAPHNHWIVWPPLKSTTIDNF